MVVGKMMKRLLVNRVLMLVREYYPEYDERSMDRIRYGVEAMYLSLTKVVVILCAAFFIGILKESLILLLLFNLLRVTGFGIHASKSWMCWISSSLIFIGCPLLCIYMTIPRYIVISLEVISLINLYLYAPADTIKRPLKNKKKRLIYKVLTCITGVVYLFLSIYLDNSFLVNTLLFAMIIEVVLTHPLTYKIFNLPYKNYVKYVLSTV